MISPIFPATVRYDECARGEGLKKYGMFVADNGGDWRMSIAPDARIKGLDELKRVKGRDFEVIVPTGPFDGRKAMYRTAK